jgi:hypothetical protein
VSAARQYGYALAGLIVASLILGVAGIVVGVLALLGVVTAGEVVVFSVATLAAFGAMAGTVCDSAGRRRRR